jgi:Sugar (and other) transporter
MPESPRWLFLNNKTDKALSILMKMHGTDDTENEEVQKELMLIHQAIEVEEINNARQWLDLLRNTPETQNLRRIMLGWWYVIDHVLYEFSLLE